MISEPNYLMSVPDTFNQAAEAAATVIDAAVPLFATSDDLEASHKLVMATPEALMGWILLGRDAIGYARQNCRKPRVTANSWVSTLVSKQHDYGPNNILRFGLMGLQVRTWDKIARIQNLEGRDATPANESLFDSAMDIVGYSMIAVMLNWEVFDLPLEEVA